MSRLWRSATSCGTSTRRPHRTPPINSADSALLSTFQVLMGTKAIYEKRIVTWEEVAERQVLFGLWLGQAEAQTGGLSGGRHLHDLADELNGLGR